jgi:predicted small integral membrane protein
MTSATVWQAAYGAIIVAEALTGILFVIGAAVLWRLRHAGAEAFNEAKGYAVAASTLAFLVWFFGFMVVGGEWFEMWQSKIWNGQEAAFRFYISVLAVLVFVNQPDT